MLRFSRLFAFILSLILSAISLPFPAHRHLDFVCCKSAFQSVALVSDIYTIMPCRTLVSHRFAKRKTSSSFSGGSANAARILEYVLQISVHLETFRFPISPYHAATSLIVISVQFDILSEPPYGPKSDVTYRSLLGFVKASEYEKAL